VAHIKRLSNVMCQHFSGHKIKQCYAKVTRLLFAIIILVTQGH